MITEAHEAVLALMEAGFQVTFDNDNVFIKTNEATYKVVAHSATQAQAGSLYKEWSVLVCPYNRETKEYLGPAINYDALLAKDSKSNMDSPLWEVKAVCKKDDPSIKAERYKLVNQDGELIEEALIKFIPLEE